MHKPRLFLRCIVGLALAGPVSAGCASKTTTVHTYAVAEDEPPARPADAEADVAYYRARAALLAKEIAREVGPTDYVRLRRGRLYAAEADRKTMMELDTRLNEAGRSGNPSAVLEATSAILAVNQADFRAHKMRSTALREMKRADEADFHFMVSALLIESIMHSGDGRAPDTAWKVFRVEEEYDVVHMLDAQVKKQSLVGNGARRFDCLDIEKVATGEKSQVYFDVTELLVEAMRDLVKRQK